MKKIVFAAVLAFSAAASAQWSVDLPSLWWPKEFTGKSQAKAQADAQMIVASKNVAAYMKKNGLVTIYTIAALSKNKYNVISDGCQFTVVIRANSNPSVLPVSGSLACGE